MDNLRLNLKRSPTDLRDWKLVLKKSTPCPNVVNLTTRCPPVYNQGQIGSCTAQAAACMYASLVFVASMERFDPARFFIYYNTRMIQGTINEDSGATLRDTMRALQVYGVCPETMWPSTPEQLFIKPASNCYSHATNRQVLSYVAVPQNLTFMKQLLAQGFPFVLGVLVYPSFFSNPVIPLPDTRKEAVLGGHAMCVIGYDDRKQAFLVRNSWGRNWGIQGNCYLPYTYVLNRFLTFDIWAMYSVEIPSNFAVKKPIRRQRRRR